MQVSEFLDKLYTLKYTAQVNQRYHQAKQGLMWRWDKIVKIVVAVLAMLALAAVFLPHDWKWLEIVAALSAAVAAIVLNVIPVGEWETVYGELFRAWNDLLLDTEQLELKACELDPSSAVQDHLVERLRELASRQCHIEGGEPPPNEGLLLRCQREVNERIYGEGYRDYEQIVDLYKPKEGATAGTGAGHA